MSPAHVLDKYYLAITLLVTCGYQFTGFFIAWTLQFDKITDFTGGSNFFILALLTLLMGNTYFARNIVVSILVMIWASRIAGFLLYRVLKTGSDSRFDDIRSHFFKFLGFWIGQILWIWTVSLPITILNSPSVSDLAIGGANPEFGTGRDIAGVIIWGIGFLIESIADIQKFRFKQNKKAPKDMPMNTGLWAWSRHPSYFGEMLCWWGIWTIAISPATNASIPSVSRAALYGSVVSPLFTFVLLMFGSGIPTAEKPQAERYFLKTYGANGDYPHAWKNHQDYTEQTSILFPLPAMLYRPLPRVLKQTLLMDFAFYRFNEDTDGRKALEREQGGV
ncbi:DUF1295-domain-containing protein [Cylindrobasidium torrendii FP15055 ss-10]|uniref:DUF1295-domain-containing protein n=1 Tax=Cylindrobasidium torrendii FP15055 ss-10 TaxID=1314674 RepID=A0A0D7BKZ8_9AGAR|nr:DUF1295-domain-containing protein [Cylindrobasidium torrendii FP15055 ss-10]